MDIRAANVASGCGKICGECELYQFCKGLSAEDVRRAIYEAERDCILSSYPFTKKGWVYELIPREDRGEEPERRRLGKLYDERWIYRRLSLGLEV
ncbi:MAG: hypothetical protein QXO47_08200 [Thermoproteota archaeon]